MKNIHRVNREIKCRQLILIDETGKNLGVMNLEEALKISESRGYDLVEVAPSAVPPVCKMMDYGKYKYELRKREKRAKKAHKKIEVKEIRLRTTISSHDLATKLNRAREFLQEGNKVKFAVFFRGRENTIASKGEELLNKCVEYLKDISIIEKPINKEGYIMITVLAPKKVKTKGGKENAEVKNTQGSIQADKNNIQR